MKLSESFYSVQGEGHTFGVPAYFIRLAKCNLMCGGPGGKWQGEEREGVTCSWWCDTEVVWRQGDEVTNEQLLDKIVTEGEEQGVDIFQGILDGVVHLVWTGGEPTMPHSREAILSFLDFVDHRFHGRRIYNELETNGTGGPENAELYAKMDQINCSPKLANSGNKRVKRIVPEALQAISEHPNHWWKFVISYEGDLEEIERDFIAPHDLDRRRIILMPGVDNIDDLPERTRFLYDMAKKHCYRGVTRGHILAWNRTTGV